MADFLLELRSEEIPARLQAGARAELERLFRSEMEDAGVAPGPLTIWSTPRRLTLIARDLPDATEGSREEAKGPAVGAPDKAVEGFARKHGVAIDALERREVKGREVWFAVRETARRPMIDVLAQAIPAIIGRFSWPKSMRWAAASIRTDSVRWVRPLAGIVAMLGDRIVECEVHGVTSGAVTPGHRFHHTGDITLGGADDYAIKLRAAHVIVDHAERAALIRDGARHVAHEAGLSLIEDDALVEENAGLTEWPIPLLGWFDEAFLDVPPEVIRLTARTNQKYFVCETPDDALANAFVCTANIEAPDGGEAIVAGNRKVLAARLADARFFRDQDRRKTLAEHAAGLDRIVFHEKLGTLADKVDRVAALARRFAEDRIVANADPVLVEQAARLSKADLVTEMVQEFPELQGVIGRQYAQHEGLPDAVCDAIRDYYRPIGQDDAVPTAPVSVAVALADRLETLRGFFSIGEAPTGSKDPFALRRAALGVIRLVQANGLRLAVAEGDLLAFLADRLKVQQREAGVRHDLIDAVFARGGEPDLVRLLSRVQALQNFVETEEGADLLAGYKRSANILKKEGYDRTGSARAETGDAIPQTGEEDPLVLVDDPDFRDVVAARREPGSSYEPEPAEKALTDALDAAEPAAAAALKEERFGDAMAALAGLRAPIDRFFDEVTVNSDQFEQREARLALLARFRDAVDRVADFNRIEG